MYPVSQFKIFKSLLPRFCQSNSFPSNSQWIGVCCCFCPKQQILSFPIISPSLLHFLSLPKHFFFFFFWRTNFLSPYFQRHSTLNRVKLQFDKEVAATSYRSFITSYPLLSIHSMNTHTRLLGRIWIWAVEGMPWGRVPSP